MFVRYAEDGVCVFHILRGGKEDGVAMFLIHVSGEDWERD